MVAHSSAKAENRAMAHRACELIWIQSLLPEMGVVFSPCMVMYCDN